MSSSPPAIAVPPVSPAEAFSTARRILILVTVVLGSTLYATTLLIASTLLPQMQGAMSATQDEIAWTMTFNILATAVATPMTGWLAARFGRRETMTWSIFLFTLTTLMCGAAESRILCVGDGILTDIAGGISEDLDTLFISGGLAAQETATVGGNPDAGKLASYLQAHQLTPTWTIGALR